jgi:hypothetical protein
VIIIGYLPFLKKRIVELQTSTVEAAKIIFKYSSRFLTVNRSRYKPEEKKARNIGKKYSFILSIFNMS